MASTLPPPDVKYFVAALYRDVSALEKSRPLLVRAWGPIDFEGNNRLFDVTNYYEPEMGTPLYRRIISFETLSDPAALVGMKLACNELETALSGGGKRIVNLDAGYLDHNKVVLASAKEAGQKIYLGKGIYADLAGRYKAGRYQPFEWSFPDFKDGRYDADLLAMRALYLEQLKQRRSKN